MPAPDHPPWVLADRRTAARHVRGYRVDRDLSQEALAELADISRDTVIRIEGGLLEVKLSSLSRLAHALNVRISDLLE